VSATTTQVEINKSAVDFFFCIWNIQKMRKNKKEETEETEEMEWTEQSSEGKDGATIEENPSTDETNETRKLGTRSGGKDKKTKKIEEMKPKKELDRNKYNRWCRLLRKEKKMKWLKEIFDSLYMTKYDKTEKGTKRWKCLFLKGYLIPERMNKKPDKTMKDYVNKTENKSARTKNKKKDRIKKEEMMDLLTESNITKNHNYLQEIDDEVKSDEKKRYVINMGSEYETEENGVYKEDLIYEKVYEKYKLYQIFTMEWEDLSKEHPLHDYYGEQLILIKIGPNEKEYSFESLCHFLVYYWDCIHDSNILILYYQKKKPIEKCGMFLIYDLKDLSKEKIKKLSW